MTDKKSLPNTFSFTQTFLSGNNERSCGRESTKCFACEEFAMNEAINKFERRGGPYRKDDTILIGITINEYSRIQNVADSKFPFLITEYTNVRTVYYWKNVKTGEWIKGGEYPTPDDFWEWLDTCK